MKKILFCLLVFGGLFGISSAALAQNATLYFVPAIGTYAPGQTFRATVMVDTKSINVNAVAAYFTYPANKLDAIAVDTAGSAMTLFAEQTAALGRVDISGGKPTPGFSGIQKIASVDFKVKPGASGAAILSFAADAAVLSDVNNQNILSLPSSGNAAFEIGSVTIKNPPPPLPPPPPPPPLPLSPPEDDEPQDKTFQILDAKAEQVSEDSIRISWRVAKPANAQVDYGVNGLYAFSVFDAELSREHSILVTDIGTGVYNFRIKSETDAGEIALLEDVTLEDLIQEDQGEQLTSRDLIDKFPSGGFQMNSTFLILFVGLPIAVFLIIAFLFIQRVRKRRKN